ncbi:MAG: FAD-binding oxidoreductase [Gammaproteobacteria bacterium]|nr:FAD-binding oxidoreductase [Gammaproteobacteria bacterium]NNF61807.1 FAD-binding oxidoreductase [Gammaproteobacteria bacterium]NNM19731.1 FAD-binding oxidoreductase [Gammaproteobacteria bacterium]
MHNGYIDSYYNATARGIRERPALQGELTADVCVIGGGITGTSAALHLAQRGKKVVLLEAQRVGWGASGRNGGHVSVGQRKDQPALEKLVGHETAGKLWDLGLEAVQLLKALIAGHSIDCDLKSGVLYVAAKQREVSGLQQECEHLRQRYGHQSVRFIPRDELLGMLGTNRYFAGMLDETAAHLHPLNYVLGLAAAGEAAGATIYERSRVCAFEQGQTVVVRTKAGCVRARDVVIACNGYVESLSRRMAGQIMPINNFILATEPLPETEARSIIRDDVAVQDSLFVINYWKLSADNRLIFGGGENYSRRFPADIRSFVRKYMLRVYPQLAETRIDYAWGGTLAITMSRLPGFGRLADNVLYAQGYSGHGVPTATLGGKLLAEAVSGETQRFDLMAGLPTRRFPGGALLRWPALVAGMSYYALRDRL